MKCVQLGAIYYGVLIAKEHLLAVVKGVDHHGAGVTQLDLETRVAILAPPLLTSARMVLSQF